MKRFLIDEMLMRLGRWLRLLGMDVANPHGATDCELLLRARLEKRVLLTRDKSLAETCKKSNVEYILIRSDQIEDQIFEMIKNGVCPKIRPLRCTICNGMLRKVPDIDKIRWKCEDCGKLYWEGSHWSNMEKMLGKICKDLS